jgi:ribonuclease-3
MAEPRLDELNERLGLALHDPDALRQAFVHSSYFNENPQDVRGHNERLEFLGDAVIGLVVSALLYERYPDEDEGFLTARRASLVNRDALAALSLDLALDRYLLLGRGESEAGGASRPSLLAATFEALAGALFLVEGPDVTRAWLRGIFDERLGLADDAEPPKSAKSRLQEWTQRHRRTKPSYELIGTLGPPHDQTFTVAATLEGKRLAVGEGSSRQRAEEVAASGAMELLAAEISEETLRRRPPGGDDQAAGAFAGGEPARHEP